jgi:hypothetical protein
MIQLDQLDKLKDLREFTVEVELPEGKALGGMLPFDRTIENKGLFKIYATSYDEAKQIVEDYLKS